MRGPYSVEVYPGLKPHLCLMLHPYGQGHTSPKKEGYVTGKMIIATTTNQNAK